MSEAELVLLDQNELRHARTPHRWQRYIKKSKPIGCTFQ